MVTSFEKKVYSACASIPKGKVSTYSDIARAIGSPRSVRAVGNALNKNPYPSSRVSCHRVVRSDGTVGGFAHGTRRKIELLKRDGVETTGKNKIDISRYRKRK
jgi:methylated-DNA-[protein]-cysteine S-methyltransferase